MYQNDMSSESHYASLNAAWENYKKRGDRVARDFIIISYAPLVERIASRAYKKKPWIFDLNDLRQAGFLGLMEAVEKFDPSRNILFSTFAPRRIQGAIYDEINSMDWTPRSVREKIRSVIRATETHYGENQHRPSLEELAEISGLSKENVEIALNYAPKTYVGNIDNASVVDYESGKITGLVGFVAGAKEKGDNVEGIVDKTSTRQIFLDQISELCTDEEAQVLLLHFYDEKNLKDIAVLMGCSASKVSHLRKSALRKLKQSNSVEDFYFED